MSSTAYSDWRSQSLVPSWLQGYWGSRYNRTLGTVADLQINGAEQAVSARFPTDAPVDALPFLGADRGIDRYAADTDATYRARISSAWTTWQNAGTLTGLQNQLLAFGFASVALYDVNAGPSGVTPWPPQPIQTEPSWWPSVFPAIPWPPTAGAQSAQWWSRFWVVLKDPFAPRFWGTGAWGTGTWGSGATVLQITSLLALIKKWKPVHGVCSQVWFQFSSTPPYTAYVPGGP